MPPSPEPRALTSDRPQGGLYLFLGPDRAKKLQRIHALEQALHVHPFDRHHLDAAATRSADLLRCCRQQPAASPVRVIVVEQAQRLTSDTVQAMAQQRAVITATACLILLVETELALRHPLVQAGDAFVTERFPGRAEVPAKPFALTDALGRGDAAGALSAAHEQLLAGKEPLELLGLVAWQLTRWVTVRRLLDAGETMERIAAVTGMRPWQVERAQSEVARYSLGSLQALLARCWQCDVDAKRGRTTPALALEQLVIELCAPVSGAGRGAVESAHQAGFGSRGGVAVDDVP